GRESRSRRQQDDQRRQSPRWTRQHHGHRGQGRVDGWRHRRDGCRGQAHLKTWLFLALGVIAAGFLVAVGRVLVRAAGPKLPTGRAAATGFGTNFRNSLCIASYTSSKLLLLFFSVVPDEEISGTLRIGHALPKVLEAFI